MNIFESFSRRMFEFEHERTLCPGYVSSGSSVPLHVRGTWLSIESIPSFRRLPCVRFVLLHGINVTLQFRCTAIHGSRDGHHCHHHVVGTLVASGVFNGMRSLSSSWERVTLKDDDALQTIYHSPLLTALVTNGGAVELNYQNGSGYVLMINSGLLDICTQLRQPQRSFFGPGRCKRAIARPAIGNLLRLGLRRSTSFASFRSRYRRCDFSADWNGVHRYGNRPLFNRFVPHEFV